MIVTLTIARRQIRMHYQSSSSSSSFLSLSLSLSLSSLKIQTILRPTTTTTGSTVKSVVLLQSYKKSISLLLLLLLLLGSGTVSYCSCFTSSSTTTITTTTTRRRIHYYGKNYYYKSYMQQKQQGKQRLLQQQYHEITRLNNGNNNDSNNGNNSNSNNIITRFISPQLDDPYLPLSDVLVSQIIAPSIQLLWLYINKAPLPTWCKPYFGSTAAGALIAPTLIHGAALSVCWLLGSLAAKGYERTSISPIKVEKKVSNNGEDVDESNNSSSTTIITEWDYTNVYKFIIQGGAFAIGILILSTQIDLFFEYGRWVQVGENDEIDFRLLVAIVELINDIVFEAICISIWRLYLAYQTERI